MYKYLLFIILFVFSSFNSSEHKYDSSKAGSMSLSMEHPFLMEKGALLTTKFSSFDQLKSVIQIDYSKGKNPRATMTHRYLDKEVVGIIETGVNESDFIKAKKGTLLDRIKIGLKVPYAVWNKDDIMRAYILARRRYDVFGEGDASFFDFALQMVNNISKSDLENMSEIHLSEKGYLNTFNHITAQCFMTSIFSEKMADFIADVHERDRLPELVTGEFTEKQILDIENGAVDNYVDLINNEWGQELGKHLKSKYNITKDTDWTPEFTAIYLNEIQSYLSWACQIGLEPFHPSEELILKFSFKIESLMADISGY